MARALQLAARGLTTTSPNPRVGCVLMQGDKIIAEGWHQRAGGAHAEAMALQHAGERARGSTAYVSLEPCSHFGRTPPCANALIEAGVRRVVTAMTDPNPAVSGRGLQRLADAGIEVCCGLLAEEAHELNIGFIQRMRDERPWVRMKMASSLDGKTALDNGSSQWITGSAARLDGQHWRARACAILTGIGTVIKDDPLLNVRLPDCSRQPLRVIIDARLEIPLQARILTGPPVIIATASGPNPALRAKLEATGHRILHLPDGRGKVDLKALLQTLAAQEINEVHLEAGAGLSAAFVRAGLIDEFLLYLAPMLIGHHARGLLDLPALDNLDQALRLELRDVRQLGADLRILARPRRR